MMITLQLIPETKAARLRKTGFNDKDIITEYIKELKKKRKTSTSNNYLT